MRSTRIGLAGMLAAGLAMSAAPSAIDETPGSGDGKRNRPSRFPRANVSRNHPDYGLSVGQHAANKLKRSGRIY